MTEAIAKGKGWVQLLVAGMAWFWQNSRISVEELDVPKEVQQVVNEKLLPGLYLAAGRHSAGRTAKERHQREELAEREGGGGGGD